MLLGGTREGRPGFINVVEHRAYICKKCIYIKTYKNSLCVKKRCDDGYLREKSIYKRLYYHQGQKKVAIAG